MRSARGCCVLRGWGSGRAECVQWREACVYVVTATARLQRSRTRAAQLGTVKLLPR